MSASASASAPKTIVIFGAAGQQGSSLIQSLSERNTPTVRYNILALTRDTASSSAQRLAKLPGVQVKKVAADNQDKPRETFASLGLQKGDVYGVFSCQGYVDDKIMIAQGTAIADAAHELGVSHLVYSSTDTGNIPDTGISGFEAKRQVENHIRSLTPPIGYTFLKPVQFMENYVPTSPFLFKVGRTVVLRYTFYKHPERKHQLVSVRDIGRAGALAFVNGPGWLNGEVRLAGDGLTTKEIDQVFREELGEPVQLTYWFLARFVKLMVPILRDMSVFFDEHGNNVDIEALRKEIPDLEDLRTYLRRYKASQAGKA